MLFSVDRPGLIGVRRHRHFKKNLPVHDNQIVTPQTTTPTITVNKAGTNLAQTNVHKPRTAKQAIM
jgi:hypothetical protein